MNNMVQFDYWRGELGVNIAEDDDDETQLTIFNNEKLVVHVPKNVVVEETDDGYGNKVFLFSKKRDE